MDGDRLAGSMERNNSARTLELLYDTYARALYGSILKLVPEKSLADKILFNSFLQIMEQFQQFDAKRSSIFCWMLRITLCQCKQLAGVKDCAIRQAFRLG